MDELTQKSLTAHYRSLLLQHGDGPAVTQASVEGQRFRFARLCDIGDLAGRSVLDLGCGIGDMLPYLTASAGPVDYTGIDVVPEFITHAASKHSHGRFLCLDILREPFDEIFDYVLISGVFNNAVPQAESFLEKMVTRAFQACSVGLGFNFISTHVNFRDDELAYHDPAQVLDYCIRNLGRRVRLDHHYERCDVAVFVYK